MAGSRALGHVVSAILLTVFWLSVIPLYAVIRYVRNKRQPRPQGSYWLDAIPATQQSSRYHF